MPLEETTQPATETAPAAEQTPQVEAQVEESKVDPDLAAAVKEAQEAIKARVAKASSKPASKDEPKPDDKAEAKTEEKKDEPPKAEEKKPEEQVGSPEEELAKWVQQQRAASQERAQARRERDELAKQREAFQKEQESLKSQRELISKFESLKTTDPAAAVELLMGKESTHGDLVYRLLDRLKQQGDDGTGTPETDRERLIEEKIQEGIQRHEQERLAAEQARKQQEEQQRAQQNQERKEAYFSGLQQFYRDNREKFPYLMVDPVDVPEVEALIQSTYAQTGKILEAPDVLAHFNKVREDKAIKLGEVRQKLNPPAVTPTTFGKLPTTPRAKVDSEAKPAKAGGDLSSLPLKEQIARRIQMLNEMGRGQT
jgi:hypothetical protein